jgi:PAT family beta-lactamase induction signal transducer AmpG
VSLEPSRATAWQRWRRALEVYSDPRQLIILLQGFASGMPFLLSGSVLSYWMATEHVDLTIIGIFSLVGLP